MTLTALELRALLASHIAAGRAANNLSQHSTDPQIAAEARLAAKVAKAIEEAVAEDLSSHNTNPDPPRPKHRVGPG